MTTATSPGPVAYDGLPGLIALMTGDDKHDQASHSTLDVLWVLYDRVLRVTPQTITDDARDRFLLSKGHGPMAYYAVLAAKGFVDPGELPGSGRLAGFLACTRTTCWFPGPRYPAAPSGTGCRWRSASRWGCGPAGQTRARVFVLAGDGELDEGSNHEAMAVAARLRLDALHVVVVDNASSTYGWPGGVQARFAVEGWSVLQASGRDHDALEAALTAPHPGRPHLVTAVVEPKRR